MAVPEKWGYGRTLIPTFEGGTQMKTKNIHSLMFVGLAIVGILILQFGRQTSLVHTAPPIQSEEDLQKEASQEKEEAGKSPEEIKKQWHFPVKDIRF